ncbi:MAG: putative Ig domain-containing protein, partial [Planctomycetaceae bacterium]|nr:putative Ig domain-containing protein [Planctomycetaceae bacterium]
ASTATAGSYTGSIAITGGGATAVNVPLSGTVNAAGGTLNITTGTLPNGVVGTPYNATITSTGGTGTHSWTVSAGSLPPGLSLTGGTAATTSISGTPTTAGTFNFTIQVTAGAQTDTQAYSVTVTTSGGGTGTIGGGGGGGGCSVEGGVSPWYLLAGLASLAVLGGSGPAPSQAGGLSIRQVKANARATGRLSLASRPSALKSRTPSLPRRPQWPSRSG